MNISIKNENDKVMDYLDVEIIKAMKGLYTKEEIEQELKGIIYNKAIIDITAIKNYYDENTLFNTLSYWEPSRVILVLNNTEFCNNPEFIKKLINKGYYNFSKNASEIRAYVNKPNTFEDVKKYLEGASLYNLNDKNEITAEENYNVNRNKKQKIIGLQNLTPHAGATTLMYMMVKLLKERHSVKGIEVVTDDSKYFKCDDIISSPNKEDLIIKVKTLYEMETIIIDLNGTDGKDICDEVLYLIEPGIIRINKLVKSGVNLFELSNTQKVVVTRSTLTNTELANFSYETKIKIFANIHDFNERKNDARSVESLLMQLNVM